MSALMMWSGRKVGNGYRVIKEIGRAGKNHARFMKPGYTAARLAAAYVLNGDPDAGLGAAY